MREGRVELPRPFGHRILRLLQPGTDPGSTYRPVSSGVVLCHPVPFRREQDVSENGAVACADVYVEVVSESRGVEGGTGTKNVAEHTWRPRGLSLTEASRPSALGLCQGAVREPMSAHADSGQAQESVTAEFLYSLYARLRECPERTGGGLPRLRHVSSLDERRQHFFHRILDGG